MANRFDNMKITDLAKRLEQIAVLLQKLPKEADSFVCRTPAPGGIDHFRVELSVSKTRPDALRLSLLCEGIEDIIESDGSVTGHGVGVYIESDGESAPLLAVDTDSHATEGFWNTLVPESAGETVPRTGGFPDVIPAV